ncbi:PA0061/PA0062 family lipoprotein [Pseudomonas sp. X10]
MRQPMMLIALSALGACASPLPPADPKQAWVDLYTITPGKLVMADRLDGERLNDGRYFQVTPGKHELVVRFDFEVYSGGFTTDPTERTCYLTVRYDNFQAGQRYRLEARAPVMRPVVYLYDAGRTLVVDKASDVFCIP